MSEFSLASTKTKDLSTLLLSDFMLFCSFIFSHPLYSSYFIFFSPYFFKIFSFLSPLFLTTTLLLLTFLTLTPTFVNHGVDNLPESKVSFLLTTYQTLVQTLRSKVNDYESDGLGCLEVLEAFKIAFETSTNFETSENPDDQVLVMESQRDCSQPVEEASINKGLSFENKVRLDEKPAEITPKGTNQVKAVVKLFENFLQEKDVLVENLSSKKRDKDVKSLSVESNKGTDEQKEHESMRMGSKAKLGIKISDPKVISADNGFEHAVKAKENYSQRVPRANWSNENGENYNYQTMGSYLGNFGSMRKQREWKRTLACKLFEERHSQNIDGGDEGMDLLWETYETESDNKVQSKISSKKGKKGDNYNENYYDNDNYDEDDDDDYEEETNAQLCCLQALKLSAGKMNLGMGRPNLVKFSKALKGFGWLHHVNTRRAKRGYH